MNGVIIIDEKQMVISDVEGIMTSWSGDKFTIRFDTGKKEFHEGITDEELLDRIIDGPSVEVREDVVDAPQSGRITIPPRITVPAASVVQPTGTGFPMKTATATLENTLVIGNTRMTVDPPKSRPVRATFGSAISGVAHTQAAGGAEAITPDAPSSHGIIMPEKDSTLVGKAFPLDVDQQHILNKLRQDLAVRVLHESDTLKYKNLKTNEVLKSQPFTSMNENVVRMALQTLVVVEQNLVRGRDRENLLYLDVRPTLVVESIVDETAGTGVFHFEETASVYENTVTYRTKVDDGKD